MNAQDRELVQTARGQLTRAYAPYSGFSVAAALRAENGSVHCGVNVENASYGLSQCAERNAVAVAIAAGQRRFVALAIVSSAGRPTAPCGACRQVLHEFAPQLRILCADAGDAVEEWSLAELLPGAFSATDLS